MACINMVLMKKTKGVIFLLMMFASLISTAFAGRGSMLVVHTDDQQLNQAVPITHQEEEEDIGSTGTIHGRLLRMNAKDYGNYDPSPTFTQPPYKLIPN